MNSALRAVWTNKALWATHILANAALLAAMYGWLGIPDRTVTHLVLSGIAGIAILLLVSWLHAGTLYYFERSFATGESHALASFKLSFRQIAGFTVWLVLLAASIVLVLQLKEHLQAPSNWIASQWTYRLQRPIRPASVFEVLSFVTAVLAWIVTPVIFILIWKRTWNRSYGIGYVALFIIGAYIPYRLIWWVPKLSGLYAQAASMAVRFSIAYLLAVTSWLVLASMLGGPGREERRS